MTWRQTVNDALQRATGYEVRKVDKAPPPGRRRRNKRLPGDRLVSRPAFVLSTVRSGSTLVRVLLNSHSKIHAPQELHLRYLTVTIKSKWGVTAMKELGLDARGLEYLLWDRVLHRELAASGKPRIVNKTPNDVFIADRILECWPDAQFIFLLRHPAAIVRSREKLRPGVDRDRNVKMILRYGEALERARQTYPGLTVRYEDVTADPARETQRICEFLGLQWEPAMLEYGRQQHGRYRPGLGDWADKIKSGQVQRAEPPPAEFPDALRELAAAWGYLQTGQAAALRSAGAS